MDSVNLAHTVQRDSVDLSFEVGKLKRLRAIRRKGYFLQRHQNDSLSSPVVISQLEIPLGELRIPPNAVEEFVDRDVSDPRLTLPKSAIKTEGTESYVWTVQDGVAKRQANLCGVETETGLEVKQGIEEGDVIIIAAGTSLQDGLKVTIK